MLTRQFLLEDFLSSPVILGGLLCASGDTRFLNASEFSAVFGKGSCDFLFQFATRSIIYWAPRLSQLFQLWRNWPFPSSKDSHFRNEAKFKTFLVKMKFICMRIKKHFHINGFTLSLALKQRLEATGKWPIEDKNLKIVKIFSEDCFQKETAVFLIKSSRLDNS